MDWKMAKEFIFGKISHATLAIGLIMNEMAMGFKSGLTTDNTKVNGIEE